LRLAFSPRSSAKKSITVCSAKVLVWFHVAWWLVQFLWRRRFGRDRRSRRTVSFGGSRRRVALVNGLLPIDCSGRKDDRGVLVQLLMATAAAASPKIESTSPWSADSGALAFTVGTAFGAGFALTGRRLTRSAGIETGQGSQTCLFFRLTPSIIADI